MQRSLFNERNSFCAQKLFITIIAILLVFLSACDVEVEGDPATSIVTSAEATLWKADAATEDDTEIDDINVSDLVDGTEGLHLNKLALVFDLKDYPGYEWVLGEFMLTSKTAVNITIQTKVYVDGVEKSTDEIVCKLKAGEATKVSFNFSFAYKTQVPESVEMEILFSSTLPFGTPEESTDEMGSNPVEDAVEDVVDFSTFAATEYQIKDMTFVGIQNTAV